jgi:isopentenyldiphosphate isomerase/intracellular septation protein A
MDRFAFLKALIPGFVPLFVFIAADEIWGTTIGLFVAIGWGVLEFFAYWIKDGRADRFILFDTLLLAILGTVSLFFENDIFFKLKPAVMEAVVCVLLAISAFTPNNLMIAVAERTFRGVEFTDEMRRQMKRGIALMFWLLLVHVGLIVFASFAMSKEAWAFISGGLFYILVGVIFLVGILRRKLGRFRPAKDELLPLVDKDGNIIGAEHRSVCHQGPGKLHPVVHVQLMAENGDVFLQKRAANKLIQPGRWDTAVGGHVGYGEALEVALARESSEELGLVGIPLVPLARYVWETDRESELVYLFLARIDSEYLVAKPLVLDHTEIEEGRFWHQAEIEAAIPTGILTPCFVAEYELLKKLSFVSPDPGR